MVISDDCSTDDSFEKAKEISREFPDVSWVFLQNATRAGMAENWNRSVQGASGEYIKVVGHDDILMPGCLSTQSDSLGTAHEIALCSVESNILSHSGRKLFARKRKHKTGMYCGDLFVAKCLQYAANFIGEPVSVMFRKSDFDRIGGFDKSMQYYVDVDMWLRLIAGRQFSYVAKPLCGFRVHRGGASFSLQGQAFAEFLRMEAKFSGGEKPSSASRALRRVLATRDSILRLVAYTLFG